MPNRSVSLLFVALALAGVLGAGPLRTQGMHRAPVMPRSLASPSLGIQPNVQQTGRKPFYWSVVHYQASGTSGITAGPDGATWVTDLYGGAVIRLAMDGTSTTFETPGFGAHYITNGSDGRLWMSGDTQIGAITTNGTFTPYSSPSGDHTDGGSGLAVGPDENVWFAEGAHVANANPYGRITEYAYPSGQHDNYYPAVSRGPDGRIWFTESGILGAINTKTHKIAEYSVGSGDCGLFRGLAQGGDGNMYVTCDRNAYRVSTQGATLRAYPIPGSVPTATSSTMEAPDGNVWISLGSEFGLIHVYVQDGRIEKVHNPLGTSFTSIAQGPDGNMWGMYGNVASIYLRNRLDVEPRHLDMKPSATADLRASYRDRGSSLKAVSANTGVASVVPAHEEDHFTVTAVAKGTTSIIVSDRLGNFFLVPVKVK